MNTKAIHPFFSYLGYYFIAKGIGRVTEYQKENLTQSSYIFAPNHSNNFDGYLIWSLLSKDYDIDVFMFREFWNNFPFLAPILPLFHVYPITRDHLKKEELKTEIEKLQDPNHSLIIFPQGRHVDPEIMFHFPEIHIRTIPLGAFYLAAISKKALVPVYIEPNHSFKRNTVVYGTPLFPKDFNLIGERGYVKKKNLLLFAKAWLQEMDKASKNSMILEGRPMHEYKIHKKYFDASGKHHNTLQDPNRVLKYLEELKKMYKLWQETGIQDLETLCHKCSVSPEVEESIREVYHVYERCLVRHS